MVFTKEDVEAFKKLVEKTKREGMEVAQFFVDAGLAKWKPEHEPKKER